MTGIVSLNALPRGQSAEISAIDWAALAPVEAQRLRDLGFDEGVSIEVSSRGGIFSNGPLACRIGRMIVAIRPNHAAAISVKRLAA